MENLLFCLLTGLGLLLVTLVIWLTNHFDVLRHQNELKKETICPHCQNKVIVQFYEDGYDHCGVFVVTNYNGGCPNCKKRIIQNNL